jgi:hypothetical protein
MSFTAAYTELYAIRDGEVRTQGGDRNHPRITDPDGFDTVHEQTDVSESTFKKIAITGEQEDHAEYPKQTWKTLKGFKSWKPTDAFHLDHDPSMEDIIGEIERHEDYRKGPLGYGFNIERLGVPYGGWTGAWNRFFKEVSKYTEPFAFYHSPYEHEFPDVTDFEDGSEVVYYVEVDDGEMYAEEQTFRRTNVEAEIEEKDRVAQHEFSYPE